MTEENKEWTMMRAEPVVEVPNLWGVIKAEDISHKYGGVDYMPWILVKKYVKEHAPGWDFRLLPLQAEEQPNFLHKAPDGTAYVLAQWFHKPSGFKLPEFIHAVMDNKNRPVPFDHVDARLLTDTHRRAMASSAADAFGLAGELWARMPIEDPYRELQDAQIKPKSKPKSKPKESTKKERLDRMLKFFTKYEVTKDHLEAHFDCELAKLSDDQLDSLAQLGARITKGEDPFKALGITVDGEVEDAFIID